MVCRGEWWIVVGGVGMVGEGCICKWGGVVMVCRGEWWGEGEVVYKESRVHYMEDKWGHYGVFIVPYTPMYGG